MDQKRTISSKHPMTTWPSLATRSKSRRANYSCSSRKLRNRRGARDRRDLLASWRGTRFEVVQVLREVVDNVLKDHSANDQELYHRARGLLLGAIFKSTVPDEMVAEAAKPKKK
ncbi:hypothetical protein EDB84DRAFT_1674850 [Lactarius hengduanensis]|nr:hypothetical protein EDB84DRAFT_1674850 [Lactarius hengduanensis]